MTKELFWIVLFWGMTIHSIQAQLLPSVQGIVQDSTGNVLEAATVVLLSLPDSVVSVYSLTDANGGFLLRTKKGNYALQVSYLGYQNASMSISLQKDTAVGLLVLKEVTDTLQLVEVTAKHIPVQMRGDTLSFNSAAFKVRSHDDAGDLLRQLPGLSVQEDGTILFNGQKVTEILVDGKVFFGDDAQATLRTLSADAIKKIDITDTKVSSKGVEPEDDQKTINLRLKEKAKTGTAGNMALGYGPIIPPTNTPPTLENFEDHRYQADASLSYFTPNTRSAVYGRSRNVPIFSPFTPSESTTGITRKSNAGATFNWVPSTATTWNNSYRFGLSRTTMEQSSQQTSILPEQSFERRKEQERVNLPMNHNFSTNFTHKIDKQHLFRIRLNASYQDNKNQSLREESSTELLLLQNQLQQQYNQQNQTYRLVPNVAFEKRFKKKGRQVIVNLGAKWNVNPSNSTNNALTDLYDNNGRYNRTDTLEQEQDQTNQQQTYNGSILWKEPLTEKDKLHITFNAGIERDQSSQTTFDLEGVTRLINTNLSNDFQRYYNYQAALLSWRRKDKKYRLELTGGLRRSLLRGTAPTTNLRQELYLPMGQLKWQYALAKGKKLIFTYNLYLVEMTLNQLQPFVDNADPLAIQLGNTNLRPTVNHRLRLNVDWFEQRNFSNIYTRISGLFIPNTILQQQTIDDALRLIYQPVNSTLSTNLNLVVGYNRLFQALDLVVDLNAEGSRGQRPFLLNGENQQQINYSYRFQLKLSNKKKKVIDWRLNAQVNGGLFYYDNNQAVLNAYFNQYYDGYFGVEFLKAWEASTQLGISVYTQSSGGTAPIIALWSLGLKRRFLENERLEIELRAENLLNEAVRLVRTQQAFFLTEQQTQGLGRYIMLSFRYKFKTKS